MSKKSGEHFGPRQGIRRDGGIFGPQDEKLGFFTVDQLLPRGVVIAGGADYLRQKPSGEHMLPDMGRTAMKMPLPQPQTSGPEHLRI